LIVTDTRVSSHKYPIGDSDSYFSALKKHPRLAEIVEKLIETGAITSKDIGYILRSGYFAFDLFCPTAFHGQYGPG